MLGPRRFLACAVAATVGAAGSFVAMAAISGLPALTISTAVFGGVSAAAAAAVESKPANPSPAAERAGEALPLAVLLDEAVGATGVVLHDRIVPSEPSIRVDHLAIDRSGIWILTDARGDPSAVEFHVRSALDLERALLPELEAALGRDVSEPVRSVALVHESAVGGSGARPDGVLVCTPTELLRYLRGTSRHFLAAESVTYLGGIADLHLKSSPLVEE